MKTIVDYAQLVKQQHALNKSLAPVEADPTASSKDYAIGQCFILDGELFKAKTAIAIGDALVLDTNYEAAESIEAQIEELDAENQTLTNNLSDEVETRAKLGAHNLAVCKIDSGVENGLTWIAQDDGSAIASASSMSENVNITTSEFSLKAGSYILSKNPHIGNSRIGLLVNGNIYDNVLTYGDEIAFTLANDSSNCKIRFYCTAPTGGVVESTKIQPMIRLATDKDTTYQQGAMTNRELTEGLSGKYIVAQWDKWFQVTADGTKTLATLFKELADAIVSYAQTMPSSDEMTLQYLAADGYGARPTITKITNLVTSLTNVAEGLSVGSNGAANLTRNVISTTLASCAQVVTSISPTGTVTVTTRTTSIPDSGTVLVVRASIYHKIA